MNQVFDLMDKNEIIPEELIQKIPLHMRTDYLTYKDGHSGSGLYAWYSEYPEEGAVCLKE